MTASKNVNGNGKSPSSIHIAIAALTPPRPNPAWSASNPQFTLYSQSSTILCKLGLHYCTIFVEFGSGENGITTLAYEAINPNGRIPALVDRCANDLTVWDSGAIITYIVKKYGADFKLWAERVEDQALIEAWLAYQLSGQGLYVG